MSSPSITPNILDTDGPFLNHQSRSPNRSPRTLHRTPFAEPLHAKLSASFSQMTDASWFSRSATSASGEMQRVMFSHHWRLEEETLNGFTLSCHEDLPACHRFRFCKHCGYLDTSSSLQSTHLLVDIILLNLPSHGLPASLLP